MTTHRKTQRRPVGIQKMGPRLYAQLKRALRELSWDLSKSKHPAGRGPAAAH